MKPYDVHDESTEQKRDTISFRQLFTNLLGCLLCAAFIISSLSLSPKSILERRPKSKQPFAQLNDHCAHTSPISKNEFHRRQATLVEKLTALNASAYIAEPGASANYFGNLSQTDWKLSERPLLLMITPLQDAKRPVAQISVLTPAFEASRAKSLHIPSESGFPVRYIEWPEDASPYSIASSVIPKDATNIFVDSSVRKFIADGFQNALPNAVVLSAPEEITEVRERKSRAEITLLKCANEATLRAIRAVHKHLYVGIRESEARSFMATALASVGLKNGGCLTLFGENAALPHGSGTDRALNASEFALFDCTASLHGYYSDVTRTVALPGSILSLEHMNIWNRVRKAQTIALQAAHSGALTRTVDEAARQFLASEGYAQYFTHRLGHGIGLEVHEEPYLRGASNVVIKSGHTFSNEPGIYIEGKVGVRLEDCFVIGEDGAPILLTAGAGGQSISPWAP